MKRTALAILLALSLLTTASLAETISFSGTVEASDTLQVYTGIGGTVEEVPVWEGQSVTADTVIARIRTTKVYAPEDGTITSVFAGVGDDAATVAERYGGVMYLEGKYTLKIAASTEKAYEAKENYIVHSGETVYLVSHNRTTNQGTGVISAVDGSSFTVLVNSGNFYMGDDIDIMRAADYAVSSRVGRGEVQRVSPTAINGSGCIVSCAVQAGDQVSKGQLLFETVEGSYVDSGFTGTNILAGVDGVIASLKVSQGAAAQKDSVVAEIYPKDAVWVASQVSEGDLKDISLGQPVKVELDWNMDMGISYDGVIESISALSSSGQDSAFYSVYVTFLPDESTRYGMTAMVTTIEEESEEVQVAEDSEENAVESADENAAESMETPEPAAEGMEAPPQLEKGAAAGEQEKSGRTRPEGGEWTGERNGERNGERPENLPDAQPAESSDGN